MLAWIRGLPSFISFLIWLLIVIVLIFIVGAVVHALAPAGIDWRFVISYFHWDVGFS